MSPSTETLKKMH